MQQKKKKKASKSLIRSQEGATWTLCIEGQRLEGNLGGGPQGYYMEGRLVGGKEIRVTPLVCRTSV